MSIFPTPVITGGPIFGGRTDPKGPSGGLSFSELKALWEKHATGPAAKPGVSTVAAAIALAESGGRKVTNSIGATGYWQIHPGGPQYLDGDANAAAAVAKYNGAVAAGRDGFTPWTTYTGADTPNHEKTYKKYLPKSGAPGQGIVDTAGDVAGGAVDAAKAIPDFLGKLGSAIFNPHWWLRVGMILLGVVAAVGGVWFIGREFASSQIGAVAGKALNPKL